MALNYTAPPSETKEYERPGTGNKVGRCLMVIDMGHVENTYPGAANKFKREILLVFELAKKMQDGRPFVVNWKGTMSLAETAHLSKHLESWRGARFTEEERNAFNFDKLLGKPALLNLVEATDKHDKKKVWTNIQSITPVPEGMEAPALVNEKVSFAIEEIGTDTWDKLYPWIQTQIMEKSSEGKFYLKENPGFEYGKKPASDTPDDESTGGAAAPSEQDDDDLPF